MACCSCFGPGVSSDFSPQGNRYSRELQSFSELIYDAGSREEGRSLGGYASTTGLLRRRNGPGVPLGATFERHGSAVDDLQDTLRDMSHHERGKLLRTDLLLLAPVVRELFPALPETHYTFVLPYADDLDEKAFDYLASVLESIRLEQGTTVVPLQTTGDGNCLLHAVSRGIWGVELFSDLLRQKVSEELQDNQAWYESKLSRAEVTEAIDQVRQPYRFLSNLHIVALAHVVRRPIILYASHRAVLDFGFGFHGMAGMFGPTRFDVDSWYPRPLAIGWASSAHNHFVPLVWSASQRPVEWPVQDEGPSAPHLSRTKSFDMHDPFAVSSEHRALLRARTRGTPVERPIFVQRLVEQIREQVVQLQGHMLAQMIDSGAFQKWSNEENDWSSAPLEHPPASSIALSFAPYQEHSNPLPNGRNHAFEFEKERQKGETFLPPPPSPFEPEYFPNPVYGREPPNPFDPGLDDPFLNQLPRSGTSYSDLPPVSWPPPKYGSQRTPQTFRRAHLSVQHDRNAAPILVRGSIPVDPHIYHSSDEETSPSVKRKPLHLETDLRGGSLSADRSPRAPKRSSVLNPLSELNPLTESTSFTSREKDQTYVSFIQQGQSKPDSEPFRESRPSVATSERRRPHEGPLAEPVVKKNARRLSADPSDNAQKRWRTATNTVRGAVRMRRAALEVRIDLPKGFKEVSPWWKPRGGEGRLKILEGEDPYVRAQAISRSLSKRTKVPQQEEPPARETGTLEPGPSATALVAKPKQSGQLISVNPVESVARSGQYLRDGKGRLVWVSLAKQITRKLDGVAVADAALKILARSCPVSQYAAAAARQPEIAALAATMVRLAAEYKLLTAKPLPGVRVSLPNENDLFLWHAVFEGPPSTLWAGSPFRLEVHVPEEYPRKPPDRVRFLTEMFHPNVDVSGVPYLDFLPVGGVEKPSSTNREPEGGINLRSSEGHLEQRQGTSFVGTMKGGKESTADDLAVAADRLLSAASLSAKSSSMDGCPDDSRHAKERRRRDADWDPYQGMAFVFRNVQRLLWDVDLEKVLNSEAAALFQENKSEWEHRARRYADVLGN